MTTNAEQLLGAVDDRLDRSTELTIYGRAALQLGFPNPPREYALSRDVDAVLWVGQAESLLADGNFWTVIEDVNRLFADQELYISHFFEEDQVILTPDWRAKRRRIEGPWKRLNLYRLGDADLFLSKLMRDDPIDRADALFIVRAAPLAQEQIQAAIRSARIPPVPEVEEQFRLCARRFMPA